MSSYLLFLILGLGSGATYAILGVGLVLKYRSSGIVDFAHGAVAMFIAYVFVNLRTSGLLPLPWVLLPNHITVSSGGLNTAVAVAISLVYAAVLGTILYALVYRPLRFVSPLTKVCASVGVMLYLQAVAVLNFGTNGSTTPAILPSSSITLAGITFPSDRILFAGIVIVIAAALAVVYRFSRFGLATRAGAENERGATLVGISARRIAGQNYVIASVLAGLAGILIAPIANVDPTSYSLFIVPALAAALAGRFESFWITAVAGLAIGMCQSEVVKLQSVWSWVPQQGVPEILPFAVIIVVMVARARSVLARGETVQTGSPSVGRAQNPVVTAAICLPIGAVVLIALHGPLRGAFITSLTFACIALSLVLLTGYVGQVSLAQMSFAGIGGFMLGHISHGWGLGFPFSLIVAGLCAVPVGILLGLPALRLRGVNLAVVTLAAASVADALVFNIQGFTGGVSGLAIKEPKLFGLNLSAAGSGGSPPIAFGVLVLVVLTLMALLVAQLRRGASGRTMLAIRSNERAAASVGINVARTKLAAFAVAAFIAGIGGALTGYQQGTLTPDSFGAFTSLALLAVVYVSGIGRISGALFAGIAMSAAGLFVTFLDIHFSFGKYQMIVAGLGLIVTAVANPDGVMSTATGKGPVVALFRLRDRVIRRLPVSRKEPVAARDNTAGVIEGTPISTKKKIV